MTGLAKMKNVSLSSLLGDARMESLLFKVRPELEGKTESVEIEKHHCEHCDEETTFAWVYRLKDSDEYETEVIQQICSNCKNKTLAKEVQSSLEKKRREQLRQKWFILPIPNAGFKNYKTYCNSTTKALAIATDYTKKIIQGETQNLVITGSCGSGKTLLSCAIARTLDNKEISVGFIEAQELFKRLKKTFETGEAEENRILEEFKSFQVLIIDDVGTETNKLDDTGVSWAKNKWVELINLRAGLSTIYTSNFADLTLIQVIGERASSRMFDNARFIDLFLKEDFRKRKMIN